MSINYVYVYEKTNYLIIYLLITQFNNDNKDILTRNSFRGIKRFINIKIVTIIDLNIVLI